jgi:dihydrolipoamide dehydrogenase
LREVTCDVAVVGAGTAGLHAWKAANARGVDAVLIERGAGGSTCTRTGCMPSKLLIAAGRVAHEARGAGRFGVRVEGVTVDGPAVLARMRELRDGFVQGVLDEYHQVPEDKRLQGEARFLAPDRLAVGDDVTVTARAIVLAVGAWPIVPEALQAAGDLVRTHETIFDITELPRRMAVVGTSLVGLELAQAFARLGVEVVALGKEPTIAKLSDEEADRAAQAALRAEFTLVTGVEVSAEPAGDGTARVSWTGAAEGKAVVDLILAAAGRPPELKPLDLDKAGLALDDKGVPLFDHATHRCGNTNLFVAGDVDGWRPVLHEAARGGRIAGHVAAGGEAPRLLPDLSVAFTEPNIVAVGMGYPDLPEGARVAGYPVAQDPRSKIDGHDAGLVRLYADGAGKLLGGTIVAHGGEHLGASLALALDRGMTAAEFADQAWYHPVIEEMLQHVARKLDDEGEEDAPNE